MGKELINQIDELEKSYMMPEGLKGIQRSSENVQGYLRGAGRYLSASEGSPNQPAEVMIRKATRETQQVVDKVNAFFAKDFAEYRKRVESVPFSLFKDYEPIRFE
jgi:hypothetical protein